MVNNAKKIVRKNEEMKKKFDKYYERKNHEDIFMIVISFLPVAFYVLIFALIFIFDSKPDSNISYIFAIFSVLITLAFEFAEWYKVCSRMKNNNVLNKIMHRVEIPFVLILVMFSVFIILYIAIFHRNFSCFKQHNISTDRISSFAILLYLISCCFRNVILKSREKPSEQDIQELYQKEYQKANNHKN